LERKANFKQLHKYVHWSQHSICVNPCLNVYDTFSACTVSDTRLDWPLILSHWTMTNTIINVIISKLA